MPRWVPPCPLSAATTFFINLYLLLGMARRFQKLFIGLKDRFAVGIVHSQARIESRLELVLTTANFGFNRRF